ncbi:nucleoid-associated protein [Pseudomonas sp. Q1-7]|uniref:nucleoid-associated protein n=1 Tax=Pseudomonas sp. Q1-7 TaxID=3020843 RepID=UPI00230000A5|nr:nucleoid-associated protein [Pseudomonas sp. Q1-7]
MDEQYSVPEVEDFDDAEADSEVKSEKFKMVAGITSSLERDLSQDGHPFKYVVGNLWNLSSKASIEFVEKIEKKFRRKNKFHSYFSGLPSNQTPSNLSKYINANLGFAELAEAEMKLLTHIANESERGSLVGGNLVFMHYKSVGDEDDLGRLMIVMVDKKGAFEFDEKTLEPKRLQPIDIDALRQAAMFDLTLFEVTYPRKEGDAYLHFIEGRSKAEFFKVALGCDSSVSNKKSVENIFKAISQFSALNGIKSKLQQKIAEKVYEHIENNLGSQIPLGAIQHIIDKNLPDNHSAVGKFSKFANENGFQVNAVFEATRYALEKSVSIQISDYQSNYALSVKASSIGYSDSNKPVIVDDDLEYMRIPLSQADKDAILAVLGIPESDDEGDS